MREHGGLLFALLLAAALVVTAPAARATGSGKPSAQATSAGLPSGVGGLGAPSKNQLRFQVPLELKNMMLPQGLKPTVVCWVTDAQGTELGKGKTRALLDADDGFQSSVLVVVDAKPGKALGLATDWHCALNFQSESGDAIYTASQSPQALPFQKAKPGTTFVPLVQGKFVP